MLFFASTQTTFGPFYGVLLVYTLCYMPTLALSNSLSFRQMTDPGCEFPGDPRARHDRLDRRGPVIGSLGLEASADAAADRRRGARWCSGCSAWRCRTRRR